MKQLILAILLGIAAIGICFADGGNKSEHIVCMDSTDTEITTAEIEKILSSMIRPGIFETSPLKMMFSDKPFNFVPYEDVPEPINAFPPEYPESAKKLGIQGIVVLEVYVYADGTIGQIMVIKSLMAGVGGLDEAAIDAVKQWKFQPGKAGGKPIDTIVIIPIGFIIDSHSEMLIKSIFTKDRHLYDKTPESINLAFPEIEFDRNQLNRVVTIEAKVDKEGNPRDFKVSISHQPGPGGLDEMALNAVKDLKFTPAIKDGKEVESTIFIHVEFKYKQK